MKLYDGGLAPNPYTVRLFIAERGGLDLDVEILLNGEVVSRPPYRTMYWSPAQMLAHLTVNGASLRDGDLFGSGTVSGDEPGTLGSLVELTRNAASPLTLDEGTARGFLEETGGTFTS